MARDFAALPPFDDPNTSYDYLDLENRVIGVFKEQARRSITPPDDLDLLGWLSVMQHYGAPTRLLDWSDSPFVALWFAYEVRGATDRALWGLNAYLCRRSISGSLLPRAWDHLGVWTHSTTHADGTTETRTPALETRQRDVENTFLRWCIRAQSRWPLPVVPFDSDARMSAQQTVLTATGNLMQSVDDALLRFEEWHRLRDGEPPPGGYRIGTDSTIWPLREPADVLIKVRLPNAWRTDVLNILATMGITAATLFPGLDGAGRHASMLLDIGRGTIREVITDTLSL